MPDDTTPGPIDGPGTAGSGEVPELREVPARVLAERLAARKKLTETEKELPGVIYEQTGGNQDFATIRSKGDHALFGKSTAAMKSHWISWVTPSLS